MYHHNRLLRAGINGSTELVEVPAPTASRLNNLVGAGFTPTSRTSDPPPEARIKPRPNWARLYFIYSNRKI
jgi:hypothetical protein